MKGGFFLNVVIGEGSAILELFPSKNQPLLIWRNSLLVLDFSLDVLNSVGRLYFQSDGFPGKSFDENLHPTSETQDQMQRGLLLDVVIRQSTAILELLAGEDQTLLIGRDTFLVLNLSLDVLNGVGSFDLKSDRLAGEGLDENLHASTETQHQMQS